MDKIQMIMSNNFGEYTREVYIIIGIMVLYTLYNIVIICNDKENKL